MIRHRTPTDLEAIFNRDFGNGLMSGFAVGAFVTTLLWGWMFYIATFCG